MLIAEGDGKILRSAEHLHRRRTKASRWRRKHADHSWRIKAVECLASRARCGCRYGGVWACVVGVYRDAPRRLSSVLLRSCLVNERLKVMLATLIDPLYLHRCLQRVTKYFARRVGWSRALLAATLRLLRVIWLWAPLRWRLMSSSAALSGWATKAEPCWAAFLASSWGQNSINRLNIDICTFVYKSP